MHKLKAQRGQALVEFALILPLLLSIILGIFDFGTAFNYQNNMSQLANEAARYACCNPAIQRVELSRLEEAEITAISTLYVPPKAKARTDRGMARRLESAGLPT